MRRGKPRLLKKIKIKPQNSPSSNLISKTPNVQNQINQMRHNHTQKIGIKTKKLESFRMNVNLTTRSSLNPKNE